MMRLSEGKMGRDKHSRTDHESKITYLFSFPNSMVLGPGGRLLGGGPPGPG